MNPSLRLAVSRFICYFSFWWWYSGHKHFIGYRLLPDSLWFPRGIMRIFSQPPLAYEFYEVFHFIFFIAIFCCAIGLFFRWMSWVAAILALFVVGTAQSYAYFTHTFMPVVLTFVILAGTRAADTFSVDAVLKRWLKGPPAEVPPPSHYRWPVYLVQTLFCSIFFAAGVSKLRVGGLDWITGDTLQNYVVQSYQIYSDSHRFATEMMVNRWLAQFPLLCKVLAGCTVALELAIPLALFVRRLRFPLVGLLILLQIGIYFTIFVNFRIYICLYCFWIPWDRLKFSFSR